MNPSNQEALKKALLEKYLHQQKNANVEQVMTPQPAAAQPQKHEMVLVEDIGEQITLEQFKEFVRKWLEIDNVIKKAQDAIKEKKKLRDKLSIIISKFMCKYNIEDLNTKEGRIRCRVSQVKQSVSQKKVKERISEVFAHDEQKKQEVLEKIYKPETEKVEKVSLRRLKISNQ